MDKSEKYLKEMRDEDNPIFLFATVNTSLLVQIAKGKIDSKKLAVKELENRGLDKSGKWVGMK